MSKPAVIFLNKWMEKHDLSDAGAPRDQSVDSLYRTIFDAGWPE